MIEIKAVAKKFHDKKRGQIDALKSVSLAFCDGKITALLGLNGAGKSTLMRLIQGTLCADSGAIFVDGISVCESRLTVRRNLGVLGDDVGLYKNLTARENIEYFAELQGLNQQQATTNAAWFIERLNMQSIADRRTQGFSQGERMKTSLARSLVHRPKNILLDEPLNGLDVFTARDVKHLLRELANSGHCVVVSSHQMLEIEALSDEIIVVHSGEVRFSGSLMAAQQAYGVKALEDIFVAAVSVEIEKNADEVGHV